MADPLGGGRGLVRAETSRRLANTVRLGRVVDLDEAHARVKVQTGANTTTWVPWTTGRAGPDRDWAAPEPGEQVLLLSPQGDLGQAVVVPGIYQDAHPAPADSADVRRTVYRDGTVHEYDRAAHWHLLDLRAPSGSGQALAGGEAEALIETGRITLRVGDASSLVIEAERITITVGGSSITLTPDHMTAIANMIDLNP